MTTNAPSSPVPAACGVAAYVRVSSRSQTHDMQRDAIERMATARGDVVGVWYAEKASGRSMARAELAKLREAVRTGAVRKVYVYRLDRLTRSGISDTLAIVEELRAGGCQLVSVSDGFDLHGPCADVVLSVMAWASKMERLAINERIASARERIEAEGGSWGRPPEADVKTREDIRARAAAGESQRSIAKSVRLSRPTVAAIVGRTGAYAEG